MERLIHILDQTELQFISPLRQEIEKKIREISNEKNVQKLLKQP